MVALFVVLTIVVGMSVDSIIQWRKSRREKAARLVADSLAPVYNFKDVTAPADIFLDSGHTWVHVTPSGKADVGLDSFAQKLIGRIDAVVLPDVGKEVRRGDMLFAIRQGSRRAAFASPVDGVVNMVDEDLAWHPEMIQSDPYKEGWVCSLTPKNLAQNLKQLRMADDSRSWLKDEVLKFQDFFAARPLETARLSEALEGGDQPSGGVLELADDGTWKQFAEVFLRPSEGDRLM